MKKKKNKTTDDTVEILHRRYVKDDPKIISQLNKMRKLKKNSSVKQIFPTRDLFEMEKKMKDQPIPWHILAKKRIKKYKKTGLILRGMRFRENISQRALAKKTGISQSEISNIENGKRIPSEERSKKIAKALNFDYRLLKI